MSVLAETTQAEVNAYFAKETRYWEEIYERVGVRECIFQERLRIILNLATQMNLPYGTRALDIGCGAGLASVGLAKRGFQVDAVDAVDGMVQATEGRAKEAEVKVTAQRGDVQALPFPNETFDLVVAIGVLPWVPSLEAPLREIRRVLRPGGWFVATVENAWSLRYFLDPLTTPLLGTPRKIAARLLPSARPYAAARACLVSIAQCDSAFREAGLEKLGGRTLGFGPLTAFHTDLLPATLGVTLHRALQRLADRDFPLLRAAGFQYIIWGRRFDIGRTKTPL